MGTSAGTGRAHNSVIVLAKLLPSDTDHGEAFFSFIELPNDPAQLWRTLVTVSGWPFWNPLVEWTSAQILHERERFTLLSAGALLEAQVVSVSQMRAAQLRCHRPRDPQPPAADFSLAFEPLGPVTRVSAQASVEPWLLDRFHRRFRDRSPTELLLIGLARAAAT
jgi:hypothetical protein